MKLPFFVPFLIVSLWVLSLAVAAWMADTSLGRRLAQWLDLDETEEFEE